MSAQLLELIILAGVAFFLVNKLITMLGHSEENTDHGVFGEGGRVKDVTSSTVVKEARNIVKQVVKDVKNSQTAYEDIIDLRKKNAIYEGFKKIAENVPNFDPRSFTQGAAKAVPMIIEVARSGSEEDLESLVDKRFAGEFKENIDNYPSNLVSDNLTLIINEVYFFASNVFIRVKISCAKTKFKEEWVFSKSLGDTSPRWTFCNVG